MIKKCEQYIKLQEEIEQTRFSIESLSVSPKRKRKKNSKYDDEAFTSYNPPETENVIENQTIDVKEVILAAQESEQVYYRYVGLFSSSALKSLKNHLLLFQSSIDCWAL